MLTLEGLKNYGANTEEGMARCMNNEAFYLRLVGLVPQDASFAALADRLAAGDLAGGFAAAHALKGIAANLALTPLLTPVSEITEHLRAGEEMDYAPLLAQIEQQKQQLAALAQA